MCTLPLLAGENVTSAFVVPTVAACIDLVVHIRTEGTAFVDLGHGDVHTAFNPPTM
jgi:hypothetical protein